jgi:hypothetical protein
MLGRPVRFGGLYFQLPYFAPQSRGFERTLDDGCHFVEVEGLAREVIRPQFHGFNGRRNTGMRGEKDDRNIGI